MATPQHPQEERATPVPAGVDRAPDDHDRRAEAAPAAPGAWELWYLGLGLVRRHWIALGGGAILMGVGSQALELLPVDNGLDNVIAVVISTYLYFLYLAFVERVVEHDGLGSPLSPGLYAALAAGVLGSTLAVALVGTVLLTAAALLAVFFIVPGIWFLTRTGLTVPVMVVEREGPIRSIRRSLALTSHRFWLALLTVGLALVIDEVIDAEVAIVTHSPLHGGDWVTWTVAGLISSVAVCVTAPVVSMTLQRLEPLGPAESRRHVRTTPHAP